MTLAELDVKLQEARGKPPLCLCGREVLDEHARVDDTDFNAWHLPCALAALAETRAAVEALKREEAEK